MAFYVGGRSPPDDSLYFTYAGCLFKEDNLRFSSLIVGLVSSLVVAYWVKPFLWLTGLTSVGIVFLFQKHVGFQHDLTLEVGKFLPVLWLEYVSEV